MKGMKNKHKRRVNGTARQKKDGKIEDGRKQKTEKEKREWYCKEKRKRKERGKERYKVKR
jgi:hypothetical protein